MISRGARRRRAGVPRQARGRDRRCRSPTEGGATASALRGDCHIHSTWSDGGATIEAMARDRHGPRPRVHGAHRPLAPPDDRPRPQPRAAAAAARRDRRAQRRLAPFRILTGMEVDILEDGSLDLADDLLERLDVVVASVHSKLRMERPTMTERMVLAVASPHVDILGHCTGRLLEQAPAVGVRRRPRVRRVRRSSARRSRSTAGPSARTRPTSCSSSPSTAAAGSRSTPTPTPPASSSGSPTAATGPPTARCRSSASSTPCPPTSCAPGPTDPPRTRRRCQRQRTQSGTGHCAVGRETSSQTRYEPSTVKTVHGIPTRSTTRNGVLRAPSAGSTRYADQRPPRQPVRRIASHHAAERWAVTRPREHADSSDGAGAEQAEQEGEDHHAAPMETSSSRRTPTTVRRPASVVHTMTSPEWSVLAPMDDGGMRRLSRTTG